MIPDDVDFFIRFACKIFEADKTSRNTYQQEGRRSGVHGYRAIITNMTHAHPDFIWTVWHDPQLYAKVMFVREYFNMLADNYDSFTIAIMLYSVANFEERRVQLLMLSVITMLETAFVLEMLQSPVLARICGPLDSATVFPALSPSPSPSASPSAHPPLTDAHVSPGQVSLDIS